MNEETNKEVVTKPKEKPKQPPKTTSTKDLYEKLSNPIPSEYLIKYKEDGKEFTGYQAQYSINLLNEVIGLGNWHFTCQILKEELVNKNWLIAMKGMLYLEHEGKQIVIEGHSAMYAKKIENAYKGARTSTFKQCCRYLGIGKELYNQQEEDIDEVVYEEIKEERSDKNPFNELVDKIDKASSMEELKQLEDQVKNSIDKEIFKEYNEKKILLMQQ